MLIAAHLAQLPFASIGAAIELCGQPHQDPVRFRAASRRNGRRPPVRVGTPPEFLRFCGQQSLLARGRASFSRPAKRDDNRLGAGSGSEDGTHRRLPLGQPTRRAVRRDAPTFCLLSVVLAKPLAIFGVGRFVYRRLPVIL